MLREISRSGLGRAQAQSDAQLPNDARDRVGHRHCHSADLPMAADFASFWCRASKRSARAL